MPDKSKLAGPLLVATAALLWATDTPFRLPTISALDPVFVVMFEHLIGVLALVIWALVTRRKDLFRLKWVDWLLLLIVGIGGSALATVLFTGSFRYINPSLTILLQKIQPVIVVLLAYVFLKERPKEGFFGWAIVAMIAAVILSFPDFDFSFLSGGIDVHSQGVMYALAAATLWAIATVAGKVLLRRNSAGAVTFWRYGFGLIALVVLATSAGLSLPLAALSNEQTLGALAYIALIPGLLAMVAYYGGLSRTSASVTTLVELLYPISAVAVNTYFLHSPLTLVQIGAAVVLLFSVARISLS